MLSWKWTAGGAERLGGQLGIPAVVQGREGRCEQAVGSRRNRQKRADGFEVGGEHGRGECTVLPFTDIGKTWGGNRFETAWACFRCGPVSYEWGLQFLMVEKRF